MTVKFQSESFFKEFNPDTLEYSINDNERTASIIGLKKDFDSNSQIYIPRSIIYMSKEYLITSISKRAFKKCNNIKSIRFAVDSKLLTINKCAFSETSIENIIIPSSVEELKNGCFIGAHKLNKISIIPNNQYYSVYDNKFIVGKLWPEQDNYTVLVFCICDVEIAKIPNFIEIIGPYAFCECQKLRRVEFTEDSKLQTIEKNAFLKSSIESISIPNSVTEICQGAFLSCKNIQNVEIAENSELQIIEEKAFSDSSIEIINIPFYITRNFNILHDKKAPCNGAFSLCKKLHHVKIHENSELQIIEGCAFFRSNIEQIFIPSHVTRIGEDAFSFCKMLQHVCIAQNSDLQTIENHAFFDTSITSISIPSQLKRICSNAFSSCKKLKKISIPENSQLQSIEDEAFAGSMVESLTIPNSLVKLNKKWCSMTFNLTKINVLPNNKLYSLYENKFILGKSTKKKEYFDVLVFSIRNIKIANIPSFIEIINPYAFQYNTLQQIEIKEESKLQIIGENAFNGTSISKIQIPKNVVQICWRSFYYCKKLSFIDIPIDSKLQTIEEDAFCYSAINSFIVPPSVKKLCENAFNFCNNLQIIEINDNSQLSNINTNTFAGCTRALIMVSPNLKDNINKTFFLSFKQYKKNKLYVINKLSHITNNLSSFLIKN